MPNNPAKQNWLRHYAFLVLLFISRLLKSIWVFFPGIVFVALGMVVFWTLGQGKDIIVAFSENRKAKAFFFIAIIFWVYVSWYAARMIAYMKEAKQKALIKNISADYPPERQEENLNNNSFFEIPHGFLETFPRLIGFSCFLVVQLAVLQSPLRAEREMTSGTAIKVFFVSLIVLSVINKQVADLADKNKNVVRWIFRGLLFLFIILATISVIFFRTSMMSLFWLLLLLHATFLFYINLRRKNVSQKTAIASVVQVKHSTLLSRVMDSLQVPAGETGYFVWFNVISLIGLIIYILAIVNMNVAWRLGPFPFVVLAFAVLLGFGYMLTALSIRARVNFHFIAFLFAIVLVSRESHYVRYVKPSQPIARSLYDNRKSFDVYLKEWVHQRAAAIDTSANGYPVYFVLANGGASRSGYWTASVLDSLEDLTKHTSARFSDHLFCLSGASGGSVGNATFFALLKESRDDSTLNNYSFTKSAKAYLKTDFLTYTLARMLGPDYFRYIFHIGFGEDRAGALESIFEKTASDRPAPLWPGMNKRFSSFLAENGKPYQLPILCINVTRMQDGNPGLVTNVKLDSRMFNNRVNVIDSIEAGQDISLSTAAILGARFPYISPAGRIKQEYFVDGGYFDNSGAGVVQEMIRAILTYGRNSADLDFSRIKNLRFEVIHITNSPGGASIIEPVAPIKNDLMAPLLTIVGSYDMQTTVNDSRLQNFIKDIPVISGNKATYYQIPLYKDYDELDSTKKEAPYAMNWFISDTTRKRMDKRLTQHRAFSELASTMISNR
jgi:hypothetical protein